MKLDAGADGWLCVEPLWSVERAADAVPEADRVQAAQFGSPHRRREFLSWRAVLYRELGHTVSVGYDGVGAPRLPAGKGFVGVSHGRRQVALRWSAHGPCAVDIESADREFERVAARYLTHDERILGDSFADWLCVAWCAKECLYKLSGERGIDLLRDLRLTAVDLLPAGDEGTLAGSVRNRPYSLRFARFGSDWAVWSL